MLTEVDLEVVAVVVVVVAAAAAAVVVVVPGTACRQRWMTGLAGERESCSVD